MHTLSAELDTAKLDLEVAQQDTEKATAAMGDLERVLRQFQQDREEQVSCAAPRPLFGATTHNHPIPALTAL